jgi:HAD superfamily hydrolase (TIGR01509 family)
MIKGVTFDLEGTIVDLEAAHHQAHLEVCKKAGLNYNLSEAIKKIPHFIGGPDEAIMQEIKSLAKTSMNHEEMLKLDKAIYEKELKNISIAPRTGFLKIFDEIKKIGLQTSIGSLTKEKEAIRIMENSDILKLFNFKNIILKEHVAKLKPSPDVYLETAKRMSISAKEQLVFEDSPNGIKAARAAGSMAIGMPVYNSEECISKLKDAGAYKIFKSWTEINLKTLLEEINSNVM